MDFGYASWSAELSPQKIVEFSLASETAALPFALISERLLRPDLERLSSRQPV